MQLEQLSQRFVGVQGAVMDLMLMLRQVRDGRRSMEAEDLQLVENALFGIAGELVLIPTELTDAVAEANRMRATALRDLERCGQLLKVYEAQAEENGLIPAIIRDRRARTAELVPVGGNVVMMRPDPVDRALAALDAHTGGAS
jgi:hypothetical protein